MKILRKGARANHGIKSVELKKPSLRWNATQETFDVGFGTASKDFSTDARHHYHLRIQPKEMAVILDQFADQALSMDAEEFREAFSSSLPAILRLQLLASGVKLAA